MIRPLARTLALACMCLVESPALSQQGPLLSPELLVLPDEVTSSGRWRPAANAGQPSRYALPSINASKEQDGAIETAPFRTRFQVAPVVSDAQDMSLLLTGRVAAPQDLLAHMQRYMQVVPTVPAKYSDPKFGDVRKAFSVCEQSARAYRELASSLAGSTQFVLDLRGAPSASSARAYERDCLVALEALPLPIRRVTGVLVAAGGAPWCSATVVGANRILTARHCFIDGQKGQAHDTFSQMGQGRIGFRSVEPHNGRQSFSAAWVQGRVPSVEKFGPTDDLVVLQVIDGMFEHWAQAAERLPTEEELPVPAWIVGSNATLGDVASARTALEFTRGSSPIACSLLEVTAGGCLYHSCQTGEATSGAGVLALTQDAVTILGVHNAAIAGAYGCEAEPPVDDVLNLAVQIGQIELE